MNTSPQLIDAIRCDLASDILEYGWLLSTAKSVCGVSSEAACSQVVECVVKLLRADEIVIGAAVLRDGMVKIEAWTGSPSQIEQRVSLVANHAGDSSAPGEGFWIQRRDHFDS